MCQSICNENGKMNFPMKIKKILVVSIILFLIGVVVGIWLRKDIMNAKEETFYYHWSRVPGEWTVYVNGEPAVIKTKEMMISACLKKSEIADYEIEFVLPLWKGCGWYLEEKKNIFTIATRTMGDGNKSEAYIGESHSVQKLKVGIDEQLQGKFSLILDQGKAKERFEVTFCYLGEK